MALTRSLTAAEHRIRSSFEELSRRLREERSPEELERPLAWWGLATDRRLPMVFLGRTLRELIALPFDRLQATRGVGAKKMESFVMLLARAAAETPQADPARTSGKASAVVPDGLAAATFGSPEFNPQSVSESLWARWQAAIRRHGLEQVAFGRVAPTLLDLSRASWNAPLGDYTGLTLAEMRAKKTHGEKRVRAVVTVFAAVNRALGDGQPIPQLQVRIESRFAARLEAWVARALSQDRLPSLAELRRGMAEPIVEQVRVDGGELLATLARGRLGLKGSEGSVRKTARQMNVTRARVYQLLEEISEMLRVRWPDSARWLGPLAEKFQAAGAAEPELRLVQGAAELFFVPKRSAITQAGKNGRGALGVTRRQAG